MTSPSTLQIRPMTRPEVDIAVDWAAGEGWNPGLHDSACFHAADPAGFLIGIIDGAPASCISVVRYPGKLAFLGFYIVRPELRGCGYGLATWRAGLAHIGGHNVGLDGVVAQQPSYRKSGFSLAWRNLRFGGEARDIPPPEPAAGALVPLASLAFADVEAYDRRIFATPRAAFLRLWISRPGTTALGLVRDGRLAGYGVVRPCRTGRKIGPLFADDGHGAEALLAALGTTCGSGPLFVDPPEPNAAAITMVERYGFKPVFETARMYTGPTPDIPLTSVFGVTSFELG
ncbi:MAG: GNAT family N-acetyltransferase [Proteobacteria bacterium]|nr:GNAT family N-acetyltransferase [Pseudomonadota bacterium]